MNLGQVAELGKRAAVSQRDEDDTVVRERGDRVADGRFLSTARRTRGDEHARKLARQGAFGPEFTRGVPKGLFEGGGDQISGHDTTAKPRIDETHLPLSREVTVTSGDTKEVSVEIRQLGDRNDRVVWFGRGVHFGEDFRREGLLDSRCVMCGRIDELIAGRERGRWTYWYIVAEPPAATTPSLTDSATTTKTLKNGLRSR